MRKRLYDRGAGFGMTAVLITSETPYRLALGTRFCFGKLSARPGYVACSQDGVLWYQFLPTEVRLESEREIPSAPEARSN